VNPLDLITLSRTWYSGAVGASQVGR
jgi:hypothetical protein